MSDSQANALMARSDIAYVLPDMTLRADDASGSDSSFATLDLVAGADNVTSLWAKGYTGSGINVSIIDSGIDITHKDLNGKLIEWKDFANNKSTPYDDWGHGTHVAGIIAGMGNDSGGRFKGMAYGANLFSAKVLNTSGLASYNDMIAAID